MTEQARKEGRAPPPLVDLQGIGRHYRLGNATVPVLADITLQIARGEFVAIVGPSGSGKTTLLNGIGCLDRFDTGQFRFDGIDVGALDRNAIARLRCQRIGYVFQSFHLVPRLTALRNVELPMFYAGIARRERTRRAREQLERMRLGDRADHRPGELSGGQQQRVAIARAMVNAPDLLVADEPTGALDTRTGETVLQRFEALHATGCAVIMVTHEPAIAARAQRILRLQDGRLQSDERRSV